MVVVVVVVVVVGQGPGRHGQHSGVHLRGGAHAVLEVRGAGVVVVVVVVRRRRRRSCKARARGLGATDNAPVSTCGEEHMLCWR